MNSILVAVRLLMILINYCIEYWRDFREYEKYWVSCIRQFYFILGDLKIEQDSFDKKITTPKRTI